MNDYIEMPFVGYMVHKENSGLIIVAADIISVIIMYYVFSRLFVINQEYLDTMDKNIV